MSRRLHLPARPVAADAPGPAAHAPLPPESATAARERTPAPEGAPSADLSALTARRAHVPRLLAHGSRPRLTIRLRLTLVYGMAFLLSGAGLLAITYLLVANATGSLYIARMPNGAVAVGFGGAPSAASTIGGGSGLTNIPDPGALQQLAVQQHEAELNQLLVWSIVALAIMTVVSIALGWYVAGRVLAPVRNMIGAVRDVSASNLHRRVSPAGPDDELKELGQTFDELLERLERSFAAQRQFVANASHELRTPLSRQQTLLQVALADPAATVASLRTASDRALVAGRQQEHLIEALLTLANSERGPERFEPVDIALLADRILDARRAEIESRGLTLDASLGGAHASGDARLVDRLLANLVDNAIRHNIANGWITVTTSTANGVSKLRVANSGPVIPDGEVEGLFEPFHRLGTDRTVRGDGWGLGLSIVQSIAVAHNATVAARPVEGGGLEVEVNFPPPSPPPATT